MGKQKTNKKNPPQLQGTVENKWNLSFLIYGRLLDVLFVDGGRLVGGVGSSSQYWLFAVLLLPMATQHPAQMPSRLRAIALLIPAFSL